MVGLSFRHTMIPYPASVHELTEHIDLKAVAKRGLMVGYTPDVLTDAGKRGPPMYLYLLKFFCSC